MKKYEIEEDLVKALLQYLYTRPYQEVKQGIPVLESLSEIKPKE